MVDSQDNYKFDQGVKGLTVPDPLQISRWLAFLKA